MILLFPPEDTKNESIFEMQKSDFYAAFLLKQLRSNLCRVIDKHYSQSKTCFSFTNSTGDFMPKNEKMYLFFK